jgi:predicted nucleotidyltransferase
MNQLLESCEYAFIKNNPDLKNIIYLVKSGSHAYGTNTENSDIDLRGVLIEPPRYVYGLTPFEQFDDLQTDTVIYGIKKFARLLAQANPNIVELLGVEEDCIVIMTEQGKLLKKNVDLFLSKRVVNSFGNYAIAQLRRLKNALCHDVYSETEQQAHLQDTLEAKLEHFQRTFTKFPNGGIKVYTETEPGADTLRFDIDLKGYPVKDFIGIYSELRSIIKTYNKLNHRNYKKSEDSLYKHAMHLIRLLLTGTDILDGKGIITKRNDEHELLMSIRNGEVSFDEIWEIEEEYRRKFETAAKNTKLPDKPNFEAIDRLLIRMFRDKSW